MGRGLSDLQKSVLKNCLEVDIKHWHSMWRKRLPQERDSLPMAEVVALAGDGERTASAEVVASKTVKRLISRGLLVDEYYWNIKSIRLSNEGEEKARELFPSLAKKLDREIAAAEPRCEAVKKTAYSEEQLLVLEERVHNASLKLG